MKKTKSGKHPIKCYSCGKEFAEVTHYGGENIKKSCKSCAEVDNQCPECWLKEDK